MCITRRIYPRVVAIIMGMLVAVSPTHSQENESAQQLTTLAIPILVETPGKAVFVVGEARIDGSMQIVEITSPEIVPRLEPLLRTDLVGPFQDAMADGWLSRTEADLLGVELYFDSGNLAAQIVLPLNLTAEQNVSVYAPRRLPRYPVAPNEPFRAALPLELEVTGAGETEGDPLTSYRATATPWVGYGPFVLENRTWVEDKNGETALETDSNRLVWDIRNLNSRLAVGQVDYRTRVFQTTVPLVGASFYRVGKSVSDAAVTSDYRQTVSVESASTANVYMNDRLIRSYPLQPGRYGISDFPLAPGLNTISIEIIDEFGDIQTFGADIPFAGGLLEPGYFDFGVAAGIRDWEPDYPFFSGVGRYGVSRLFTTGGALQVATDGQTAGVDALTATRFGSFGIDLVGSLNESQDVGTAVQGNYQYIRNSAEWFPAIGVVGEYRSRQFVQAGTTASGPSTFWIGRLNVIQRLPYDTGATLSFEYRRAYTGANDQARVLLALTRQFAERIDGRINASVDVLDPENWTVFVGVNVVGRGGRFSSTSSLEVPDMLLDSGVSGLAEGRMRTVSGSFGLDNYSLTDSSIGGIGAGARLTDQRYLASARGNLAFGGEGPFWDQSVGSYGYGLRTGSALYYADRTVGFGRPDNGGFILVDYADDIPADELIVNPYGQRAEGATDFTGPATLSGIRAGTPVPIEAELPGVPADYALGPLRYVVEPTYRSGTVIRVAGTRRVYARGQLLDVQGQPIDLAAIEVLPRQEPAVTIDPETPVGGLSFTDERGIFEIYGLIPGEYRVLVLGRPGLEGGFSVGPDEDRRADVGTVLIDTTSEETGNDEENDSEQ
jgi:outer membrane usher protein